MICRWVRVREEVSDFLEIVRAGVGYNCWVMKSMLMVLGVVVVFGIAGKEYFTIGFDKYYKE